MPSTERPGAPRERTGLAWQRSALGFVALAGVVLSVAAHREAPGLVAVSAALAIVAAAVWRQGRRAYERTEVQAQQQAVAFVAISTAMAALVAVVVVLVHL
jgi:putative membrane protein